MKKIKIEASCPKCKSDIIVSSEIDAAALVPVVRSKIVPIGTIPVYKITSEDIRKFIIEKAHKYVPDAKIEVAPRYCEKKRRSETDPHRAYASLRIAFSDNVIENNGSNDWYSQLGESDGSVRLVPSIFIELIAKYRYNKKEIEEWLKSYKTLEKLEDTLGMTEAYINDLKMYATPRAVTTKTKKKWVIFSAAPENVIKDMLTEVGTNKLPGRMQIVDIYPLTDDIVEFLVYMHPEDTTMDEDPYVRQFLIGDNKK